MHRSGATMAWNVFKFCTALRGLGSIMILLVLGVVGVTYYAVVLTTYGPALYEGGLDSLISVSILILFHCLLAMLLWSYFSVVLTDPGSVPPNWRPPIDEERGEADPLNGSEFINLPTDPTNQRIRFCRKCSQLKPPRCHHCSVCGRCVLKMDHHCVWVVNCVGALNYKYFLLFLFYTFLETSLVTLSLLPHFIAFFSDGEIPGTPSTLATTFLAFVLNLAFALSVLGFLIMHVSLVSANTTTIEVLIRHMRRKPLQNGAMTLVERGILNRFLGQTNDIGSSLLIRKKIFDGCLHCRGLNIHQSLTLIHRSSKKHWCSISRNPLFTLVKIDMQPPELFLNILINWTAYN
ncbi:probable protein S-acyltransferase 14 isoform X2 [Quercus lobata]|uniref:probable protein S-acyltransferase 14 isoform X2 n=1 Tax=Quercus lobata TaxID=97700 RepID=UPI00124416AC|nr:probable protein S-acyltransferase 14 isoform X2 [Quercus lobata]